MKTIFKLALLLLFIKSHAQIGINTTSPDAQLDIEATNAATPSNTDGLLIPRVNVFPATNPTAAQQGMMVYLMVTSGANTPGFYYWDNLTTNWIGISSKANDKAWYEVGTTVSPNAITDDMFHTGKVGIGISTPSSKLHAMNSASGMTPNAESVITLENSTNTYLSLLSGNESGVLFGSNGVATDGGIIYGSAGLPRGMVLRTNGNINRMVISDAGNISVGNFIATYPLQFPSSVGDKISLWGGGVNHYGLGIQGNLLQIHADIISSDIAFGYGSSAAFTERMRIKGDGNVGIGISNPLHPLHFSATLGDKISLWGGGANHHGFGVQNSLLQIHSDVAVSDIAFGYGSSAAFTENMRIKGNGNVGIGISNPLFPLHFPATLGDKITLWGSGANHHGFGVQNSLLQIHSDVAVSDIAFGYGSSAAFTENMRIKGNGNVGIGIVNPLSKLHVRTNASGMTPNPESIATIENDVNTYISLLSGSESGILFGANAVSTNGGIIYNPPAYTNGMVFRTNSNANRMVISDVGNVAIGDFTPNFPLHFSGTLGDKISLWGNGANHYGFGIQGNLLQIHSDIAVSDVAFGYGSSASFTERMRIKGNGNVGIGITNPDYPLQFATGTGDKISLFGGTGSHYGFGIEAFAMQIHSAGITDDIAFGYGSSAAFTETMRIKGTGKVGIGTPTPTAELEVNGFTKMGTTAPAVKMIKLTGTTGAVQGNTTFMTHGLTSNKILAVNILVEYAASASVPPSYNGSAGYEYDYYINATSIAIWTKSGNAASILSKPIRVLVTYEE